MTHDIHVLTTWIHIVVVIAAICTTVVPVLYSFFPWRTRRIGQVFMLQAVSFAVAMDLTALFSYWHPSDILVVFWVDAFILTAISVSTAAFAVLILKMNYDASRKGKR